MSLPKLRKLCEQKVVRTHRAHRKHARLNSCTIDEQVEFTAKEDRRRKDDRMSARRHGVCSKLTELPKLFFFLVDPC
jgi:hypothetical protein